MQSRHIVTRCIETWEMYWRVRGNESKVRLIGLTTANAEGDKLPVFVNFRDQTIIPETWRQLRYLETPISHRPLSLIADFSFFWWILCLFTYLHISSFVFVCLCTSLFADLFDIPPFYLFVLLYVKRRTFDQKKKRSFFIEDNARKAQQNIDSEFDSIYTFSRWAVSIALATVPFPIVHRFLSRIIRKFKAERFFYRAFLPPCLYIVRIFRVELFSENDSDRNRHSGGRFLHDPWIFCYPL